MSKGNTSLNRRTLLKAFAGLPILGLMGYAVKDKLNFDQTKKSAVLKELGLEDLKTLNTNNNQVAKGNLLRIGIIGYGSRAKDLANGLGFIHPDDSEDLKKTNSLNDWLAQDNLNVALTGICDVFDLHAEKGLATARNKIRVGGDDAADLPVKRYRTYREMLDDKDIDAVMIATPDHHHARITIEAVNAGKHVYCEKSPAINETELNELYNTVRNSDRVYQLGHQISQNTIFQQAREIINRNILGKITLVEATSNRNTASGAWIRDKDGAGNPKPGNVKSIDWKQWLGSTPYVPFSGDRFYNWTKWFAYDLGMIGQLFTHEFDAINQLLRIGIPKSAVATGGIYYWKDNREIPDSLNCVFEYPNKDLTLLYSASLASSRHRGRVIMGHDGSMEIGGSLQITADQNSSRYEKQIKNGTIDTATPMISVSQGSDEIDAVTSATAKYYASRGLTSTNINGKSVNLTYLHIREWVNCIRTGETPSVNIERAFEEGITCLMAHKAYIEKRRVEWDPIDMRII